MSEDDHLKMCKNGSKWVSNDDEQTEDLLCIPLLKYFHFLLLYSLKHCKKQTPHTYL